MKQLWFVGVVDGFWQAVLVEEGWGLAGPFFVGSLFHGGSFQLPYLFRWGSRNCSSLPSQKSRATAESAPVIRMVPIRSCSL